MRAAAAFAAAYGFPPSACGTTEEAMGLLRNVNFALAIRASSVAAGAATVMSADAAADLAKELGARPRDVAALRLAGMKQQAMRR